MPTVRLGKGIVYAKDTPNFIANRIGTFSMVNIVRLMQEFDFSIEDVDALTGSAIGFPKSATFRTVDMVGLDVLDHVVRNAKRLDPALAGAGSGAAGGLDERGDLELPAFVGQMLDASCWATRPTRASTGRSAVPRANSAWRWTGRPSNTAPRSVPNFLPWRWPRPSIRWASGCAC